MLRHWGNFVRLRSFAWWWQMVSSTWFILSPYRLYVPWPRLWTNNWINDCCGKKATKAEWDKFGLLVNLNFCPALLGTLDPDWDAWMAACSSLIKRKQWSRQMGKHLLTFKSIQISCSSMKRNCSQSLGKCLSPGTSTRRTDEAFT